MYGRLDVASFFREERKKGRAAEMMEEVAERDVSELGVSADVVFCSRLFAPEVLSDHFSRISSSHTPLTGIHYVHKSFFLLTEHKTFSENRNHIPRHHSPTLYGPSA